MNNPVVANMIDDLQTLKDGITLTVKDLITILELQIANAQQEEIASRKKLSNNPTQELYLQSTGREQKIKEELYLFLLQKREENELNQAFTAYNTKILNMARGSNTPVAPQRKMILLLGFAVGLFLPIIFLAAKASFNVMVESKDDLSVLSIPFLGIIPLMESKRKWWHKFIKNKLPEQDISELIISNKGRDVMSESLRMVRTNLDFVVPQTTECKVINITSYQPKSGKSFIAVNLALSFAIKNVRVLAVDGDFRRGTLSEYASSPKKGCVDYLSSRVSDIKQVIVKSDFHPMLDVLPMGTMPPNPTELLLTSRFAELIEKLRAEYDYIIFDCPPVEIVPDAKVIEKFCDSTMFVIRAGLMDKRELPELQEFYDTKRLKNMCLVLNGVDYSKSSRYGYGAYGRYGYGKYGYGSYGYGQTEDEK